MSLTPSERNLADAYEKCPGNPMSGASQTPGEAVKNSPPPAPPELKGAREWKLSFDHYHAFNPSVDGPCGDHGESVTVREVLPPESPTPHSEGGSK